MPVNFDPLIVQNHRSEIAQQGMEEYAPKDLKTALFARTAFVALSASVCVGFLVAGCLMLMLPATIGFLYLGIALAAFLITVVAYKKHREFCALCACLGIAAIGMQEMREKRFISDNYLTRWQAEEEFENIKETFKDTEKKIGEMRKDIEKKWKKLGDGRNAFEEARIAAQMIQEKGMGNCSEITSYLFFYLLNRLHPSIKLDRVQIICGDHAFLLINRDPNSDIRDPSKWGKDAVILDPWSLKFYPAALYLTKLKACHPSSYKSWKPVPVDFKPDSKEPHKEIDVTRTQFLGDIKEEEEQLLSKEDMKAIAQTLKKFHVADSRQDKLYHAYFLHEILSKYELPADGVAQELATQVEEYLEDNYHEFGLVTTNFFSVTEFHSYSRGGFKELEALLKDFHAARNHEERVAAAEKIVNSSLSCEDEQDSTVSQLLSQMNYFLKTPRKVAASLGNDPSSSDSDSDNE